MQHVMKQVFWVVLTLTWVSSPASAADTLAAVELAELKAYLADLQQGKPGSAIQTDRLAELPFAGLKATIQAYVDLKEPIEPATHRAFQALLERLSREAHSPWLMVTFYSPAFADFLTKPLTGHPLSQELFERLRTSETGRLALDLAVRLTPEAALRYLASGKPAGRGELLEAWNRRLAVGKEQRPIPGLDGFIGTVSRALSIDSAELEAHLRFVASWPAQHKQYQAGLQGCLQSNSPAVVTAGLNVQHRVPVALDLNEPLVTKFAGHARIVELAIRNYAFDEGHDHSGVLRRLWKTLKPEQTKARRNCLFAMSIHWRGNDAVALKAVLEESYEFFDVALPILKQGDRQKLRIALHHLLTDAKRGHEEALRLARELELRGFEEAAARIALDGNRDQILRQTALHYLQLADGKTRRQLMPLLAHPNADIRLSAIRMFNEKKGLSKEDLGEIGPALIRFAMDDPSKGHRQEAIYVLGSWREPSAADFFRQILKENLPVSGQTGWNTDSHYWTYRFRLVALLGLTKLGDAAARKELLALHRTGGPTERMDVLLAFVDLGEVPEAAWEDLSAHEPRLVATATHLIASHGDAPAKERLKKFFRDSPFWMAFLDSGIDDYNILRLAGVHDFGK